jgi:hypothetical protein
VYKSILHRDLAIQELENLIFLAFLHDKEGEEEERIG